MVRRQDKGVQVGDDARQRADDGAGEAPAPTAAGGGRRHRAGGDDAPPAEGAERVGDAPSGIAPPQEARCRQEVMIAPGIDLACRDGGGGCRGGGGAAPNPPPHAVTPGEAFFCSDFWRSNGQKKLRGGGVPTAIFGVLGCVAGPCAPVDIYFLVIFLMVGLDEKNRCI